jgi:hypothetical protein
MNGISGLRGNGRVRGLDKNLAEKLYDDSLRLVKVVRIWSRSHPFAANAKEWGTLLLKVIFDLVEIA